MVNTNGEHSKLVYWLSYGIHTVCMWRKAEELADMWKCGKIKIEL